LITSWVKFHDYYALFPVLQDIKEP